MRRAELRIFVMIGGMTRRWLRLRFRGLVKGMLVGWGHLLMTGGMMSLSSLWEWSHEERSNEDENFWYRMSLKGIR